MERCDLSTIHQIEGGSFSVRDKKQEKEEAQIFDQAYQELLSLKREANKTGDLKTFDDKYQLLKERLIKENSEIIQTIEVLLGIKEMIGTKERLEAGRRDKKRRITDKEILTRAFEDMTEWQFSTTHLLLTRGKDQNFTKFFWDNFYRFYDLSSEKRDNDLKKDKRILRSGLVNQVAVFKILKALGHNIQIAAPKYDALEKTDFFIDVSKDSSVAIQAKHDSNRTGSIFERVDTVSFPSAAIIENDRETYISSKKWDEEISQLKRSCRNMSIEQQKDIKGLLLVIPKYIEKTDGQKIYAVDYNNGDPTKELLDELRPKDQEYFSQ